MNTQISKINCQVMIIGLLLLFISVESSAQQIITSDVKNFWKAYDSIQKVNDTLVQDKIIRELYFQTASRGLTEFVKIRKWTPEKFRWRISAYPLFWNSVRPLTVGISKDSLAIVNLFTRYAILYKGFHPPRVYFTISPVATGGTTTQDKVLIGTEISAGDKTVNAIGLNPFLIAFFKTNPGVTSLVAHELTHTQQKGGDMEDRRNTDLLGLCLAEGMCDFMAELLLNKPLDRPYLTYGFAHQKELWNKFQSQMNGREFSDWLYNGGIVKNREVDLGYFIGYAICRSYYNRVWDKSVAIKNILSLNLDSTVAINKFLLHSGYKGKLSIS